MKRLFFVLIVLSNTFYGYGKNVKFTVNMTGQVLSPQGIHVMGDFQNAAGFGADWTPNTCLMTQDVLDTNLYHFVVSIPAFAKYEYKYINGDQSYEVEIVPVESQVGYAFDDNRWIYIDSLDADTMDLAPLVFSANAPAGINMIRFLVDMSGQTVSATGIHVAGSFQSTNPATDRLYSFGNNVFEIISYMTLGNYTYKFYNGNTLATAEIVPLACATGGDRTINLMNDIVLNTVCFSSCTACYPTALLSTERETITIQLYPNPMTQSTKIVFHDHSSFHHMAIMDNSGRIIEKRLYCTDNSIELGNLRLAQGIYTVMIENEVGKRSSHKLIVE